MNHSNNFYFNISNILTWKFNFKKKLILLKYFLFWIHSNKKLWCNVLLQIILWNYITISWNLWKPKTGLCLWWCDNMGRARSSSGWSRAPNRSKFTLLIYLTSVWLSILFTFCFDFIFTLYFYYFVYFGFNISLLRIY